jgi:ligand-binding sensor domain-containing protein
MLLDSRGTLWVGTLEGVCTFEDGRFVPFDLPSTVPDPTRGVTGKDLVHCIYEDSQGRVWFGTNAGAFYYQDGGLRMISAAEGMCGKVVNDIQEDGEGNIWFATHHHGVCRWDGYRFTSFGPADGVQGTEVWDLFRDHAGNIWFPVENQGLYRFDGKEFTRFSGDQGLASPAVQCTYEDAAGRLWAGGYLGLYRLEGDRFVNVTMAGPWPPVSAPE